MESEDRVASEAVISLRFLLQISEWSTNKHIANSSCGSWISAFGIKRAIRCFDTLEALGGFCNRPSNREIIGLAFDYEPVSPGRKYKIGILRPNHHHLGALTQRRYSELI